MRSQTVLQMGLGVAFMAVMLSVAAAADQPNSDKDMAPIPKGTRVVTGVAIRRLS